MPSKRGEKGRSKARRARNQASSSSSNSTTLNTSASSNASLLSLTPKRQAATKASGRTTKNSMGSRGRKSARRTPVAKSNSRRGRNKKDNAPLQDPQSYKSETGEVYRIGGTVVDGHIVQRSVLSNC